MEIRFKLNPKNGKYKTIIDLLGGEYNSTNFIKSLLYKVATGGTQGITMSFGGYVNSVNVSNAIPCNTPINTLDNETDIAVTPINDDISIQLNDTRNIENEFGDYFF